MNATLPMTRLAGETTLANGTRVRVKLLNSLQQEEAEREAGWHAQTHCRRYRCGGDRYEALRADFAEMDAEQQAVYLAGQEIALGSLLEEAAEKYPDPPEPQRNDLTEAQFAAAWKKWEQSCRKAEEKRLKYQESRYEAARKDAMALPTEARLERCLEAALQRRYLDTFLTRLTLETLYRAVRVEEDPLARYYPSVEAVEDADDAERSQLVDFYVQLNERSA